MTVGAPHEPEIEALAKAARAFLWVVRRAFALAGGLAFVWGLELVAGGTWVFVAPYSLVTPVMGFTCFSLGLPLVLPVDWTFGRGRWPLLAIASVLWFAPSAMQDDTEYG